MLNKATQKISNKTSLQQVIHQVTCPACGYHVAVQFYDGGEQPLATLAWPTSEKQAKAMEKLPLNFIRCVDCGHVYNKDFDYKKVPYSDKPNLMYNRGKLWQDHVQATAKLLADRLPANPVIIEIGAGTGHFLKAVAALAPGGRYIAFDPNGCSTELKSLEFYPELFQPSVHMAQFKPDLIICRHVLEHLTNPLGFVQEIAFAAQWEGLATELFIEVPCINKVFETGRTADFFYEHHSNFTSESLGKMLTRANTTIEHLSCGYDEEVVFALSRLNTQATTGGHLQETAQESLRFFETAHNIDRSVRAQLETILKSGDKIGIWGGTGKSAAFINRYGVDARRFPIVLDSDYDKAGTCVPGTGQVIRTPEYLEDHPVDVILITTQWRAQDIALEIKERGILCNRLLLEYQGNLIDFYHDEHPYRTATTKKSKSKKHFGSWKK